MIRHRLRTLTLLTGTLLSLLIVAAFVASSRWVVAIQVQRPRGPAIYFVAGSAVIILNDTMKAPSFVERHFDGLSRWNRWDDETIGYHEFPLYVPFLAVAVPTLLLRRFRPKPLKPGHCRCGYDLTGNTSGVCPECGIEVQT